MARVARLVLVLASGFGFVMCSPAQSQAGVIPWVYDAIFGPVGSLRAQRAGYPMAAGYAPYSAGYAPYSVGYAPYYTSYTSSYAPVSMASYESYGGSGCSTCNQSANYAPVTGFDSSFGSTGCSTCGSGNCSTGTCSNCTVNSAPTTSGYGPSGISGPTPDPNLGAREEIRRLERKIEELDHREKQTEKFLRRNHSDYLPEQFQPSTYSDEEEVRARIKKDTIESESANPNNFPKPIIRGKGAPSNLPADEEGERESLKPEIKIPPKDDEKKNEGTTQVHETEPQANRLENRITTRAIAPRERMQIVTKQSKVSVAKSGKSSVKTSETSRPAEIARH